uniref:Aminoadipate aminotransferase n=1 Tax=Sinocyclocheilus anshuiensis TaxID=1608454 RepID=A0A671SMR4_9TELE
MKDLQKSLHNPPTAGYSPERGQMEMCVTTGSQEGLCKIFEMLVNSGDSVLLDAPTQLYELQPLGCNRINGMIPADLRKLLERWDPADAQKPGSSVPRVLYTIPNGGNPTRASVTCERKQEVYEVSRVYSSVHTYSGENISIEHVTIFLSKYISKGAVDMKFSPDMGLVTGPKPLVDRVVMHTSTFTRLIVSQLLHSWGPEGFLKHIDGGIEFYRSQRNAMLSSADQWLKGWTLISTASVMDTIILLLLIMERALEKEVQHTHTHLRNSHVHKSSHSLHLC